jgi:hypothetical protein
VSLFWLNYRHPDGRAAGEVVVDSPDLLQARFKAAVYGFDRGLESGHQLDLASADQIPANIMDRLLDDGDLRKLHRMLLKKKPPVPSVRRRTATKRRVGSDDQARRADPANDARQHAPERCTRAVRR